MIKTYSYEEGIAEQVVKPRYPGAPGLEDRKTIDVEALYHIEPDKMGNEFRFILTKYIDEPFLVLQRYRSPEELFIEMHNGGENRFAYALEDEVQGRYVYIAGHHFYYNGECIPAHYFQDIVSFVYQHIADKLMNDGYSHGLKESLQEAEQSCQGQETEGEEEQERE